MLLSWYPCEIVVAVRVAMMSLDNKIKRHKIIFLFCFFFLFYSFQSEAGDAQFTDVLVTNNAGQIMVYARITNCFTRAIEAVILAGVPTTFTFLFDFYESRHLWWDKRIVHRVIDHTIKYDSVKRIFILYSSNGRESGIFQSFESAKRAMADLNGVVVAPVNVLERGKSYYLEMKAQMDKVRLPLRLEYLFFFVSYLDFETDWHRHEVVF